MLKELTYQYIKAFDAKDIEAVAELLSDAFTLEDPVVKRLEGKENALHAMQEIFNSCQRLSFQAKHIFQDSNTTIIEFILQLDTATLTGTDIIEWNEIGKMKELRAYLDIPK